MSIISSAHAVQNHSSTSKAFQNQRLVVLHYKGRKVKNADGTETAIPRFPSLCVSIPFLNLNLSSMPEAMRAPTVNLWESLQDDLIRSLIDQKRSKDSAGNATMGSAKHSIEDDEISLSAIAAFASATGNGKLSSDSIGSWFDSTLAELLLAAILQSDPTRSDDACTDVLSSYRAELIKLAAVVPAIPASNIKVIRKALLRSPEDDRMAERLLAKLDAMDRKQPSAALADLL